MPRRRRGKLRQSDYMIIIGAVGVLVVITTLFPIGDVIVITNEEGVDDITVQQPQGSAEEASIVPNSRDFTTSDKSGFENYLDENAPLGITATERVVLEVATVLFDSDQKQLPSSSFLDIPKSGTVPEIKINELENDIIYLDGGNDFSRWENFVNINAGFTAKFDDGFAIVGSQKNAGNCKPSSQRTPDGNCLEPNRDPYTGERYNVDCLTASSVKNSKGETDFSPCGKSDRAQPPSLWDAEVGFKTSVLVIDRDISKALTLSFDYDVVKCEGVEFYVKINSKGFKLNCSADQHFERDLSGDLGNTEVVTLEVVGKPTNYYTHSAVFKATNIKLVNDASKNITSPLQSLFALFDEDNRILDLGSIQSGFYVVSNFEGDLNIDGVVEVWLDDKLVTTKKIFSKADGIKSTRVKLNVGDSITAQNADTQITFTFSDEGKDWGHGTTHYYRIKLTEITATDQNKDVFTWSGEKVVYNKKMIVDGQKIVSREGDDSAVAIFKSDGSVSRCISGITWYGGSSKRSYTDSTPSLYKQPPPVEVWIDGKLFGRSDDGIKVGNFQGSHGVSFCAVDTIKNIPRFFDSITIKVSGEEYRIFTPKTTPSYGISCQSAGTDPSRGYPVPPCTSNFGWSE